MQTRRDIGIVRNLFVEIKRASVEDIHDIARWNKEIHDACR